MHISNMVKPIFWFAPLFVVVSLACSSSTVAPTQPASTPAHDPTEVTGLHQENDTPEPSNTSAPLLATSSQAAPISQQPVLGYIDSSPAVFIQPESGLSIKIFDAVYDPKTGGLKSYSATIHQSEGNSMNLEFHDIAFNTSSGHVDAYQVAMNGNDLQGPTIEEFESHKSELGPLVAFSLNSFAGTEPLPMVSVPCQGDSKVEYGQAEGYQQVVHHTVICDSQTYTLQYSNYAYNDQLGTLVSYSVVVEITP